MMMSRSLTPLAPALLLSRGFVGLCLVTLLTSVGVCQFFVYAVVLRAHGLGEGEIGVIMGAYYVGSLLGMPVAARLTRLLGARRVIYLGLAASTLSALLLWATNDYVWLTALRLGQGVSWSLLLIPLSLVATGIVPQNRLAQALAIHGSCFLLGQAIGPWIGEALASHPDFSFFGSAAFAIGAAVAFMPLVPEAPEVTNEQTLHRSEWMTSAVPLLSNSLFIFGFGASISFVADYASLVGLQGSASKFFVAWMTGGLLIRFVAARSLDRFERLSVASFGGAVSSIGLVLLSMVSEPWQFWIAGFLVGGGSSIYSPSLLAVIVDRSSSRLSAVTIFRETSTFTMAAAAVSGGFVAARLSYPVLFLFTGALSIFGCAGLIIEGRRTR